MNHSEVIKEIAGNLSMKQVDVRAAIAAFIDYVKISIEKDGRYQIPNLGVLSIKNRAARTGKNPRTGESVEIPEHKGVAFKAAKSFADSLNSK